MKKFRKIVLRVLIVAGVLAAAWGGYRFMQQLPQRQREVPTARVRKGDVIVRTFSRGELRAVRSVTLIAPNLFGSVQVTRLAPLGAFAREGDLIVQFDDSEVLGRLEEKQIELDQVSERIKKAEADLAIRTNQDEVELLRARYAVRRADLEVKRNELLSAIDAKKNELNLKEAQQRLDKLKSDIESRRKQAEAEIAVLREEKNKAELEMAREKSRLRQVKVLAPMGGLVAIRQQRGNFFFAGTQMPDIREGDELRPGMPVADVLDLSDLEIMARVGELDRANLREGQNVVIQLDALPEKPINGRIKGLSGTASADPYSNDPAKKFDVTFQVDMRQLLTTLGAKPDQVQRILSTAEHNRRRSPAQAAQPPTMLAGMMSPGGGGFGGAQGGSGGFGGGQAGAGGGFAAGGAGGGQPGAGGGFPSGFAQAGGAPGGAAAAGGQQRRPGGGFTQMLSRLPEEQRKKVQEALDKELKGKKIEDLTPEERRETFGKLRAAGVLPQGGPPAGGAPGGAAAPSEGGGGPASQGGAEITAMARVGSSQFSDAQLASARLPLPPEEESQLDVLLRPGLLADVQIIVEKIPDVIHIPVQAVFERANQPMVYVKIKGKFEERLIKPLKRSENTMVVAEGLAEDETVALADPYAKPGAKKSEEPQGGAPPNPMGGFGGGGGRSR
ncbi:MAG: efflux RND transporter periplasmic adaptor subunit [Bryobacteraceae bacterium]|nr:efflux RND transporter periplasmic adaptor subunit [Bryobacteraceae bacterium]